MLATSTDLYAGKDPRELPVYGPREAAACLNIPESTLLRWTTGHLGVWPVLTVEREHKPVVTFLCQRDAPSCCDCGAIMVRHGACYKCLNCGATSGCW